MNCSACGSPLQFDRVVFRCACGAYVHAYCVDKHIIESHRPEMEEGYSDLNGDFHPKHKPAPTPVAAHPSAEREAGDSAETAGATEAEEEEPEDLVPGEQVLDESDDDIDAEDDSDDER